jgi:hypothetical protein
LGDVPVVRDGIATVYVAVRFAECFTRPVRVHPAGCGCDETGCEYSRVRDSYEIKVLWNLPASHVQAVNDDAAWCAAVQQAGADLTRLHTFPVPPCPVCESDPWVVLAAVSFSTGGNVSAAGKPPISISTRPRRVLLSTQRLQVATVCLP